MLILAEHLVVSIMTSYSLACWNYRTQKGILSKESSKNLISCYFYLLLQSSVRGVACGPLTHQIWAPPQAATFWYRSLQFLQLTKGCRTCSSLPKFETWKDMMSSCHSQMSIQLQPWAQPLLDALGLELSQEEMPTSSVHAITGDSSWGRHSDFCRGCLSLKR